MTQNQECPLCRSATENVLWRGERARVISVDDSAYPGYTRVIWHDHIAEMTDLPTAHRDELMHIVWQVERALRTCLGPDKVNLAQFGNMVPHLHWHIIPRWRADSHFPEAIWAPRPSRSDTQIAAWSSQKAALLTRLPGYHKALAAALEQSAP
ncbi:MAG TPA: HIT family protein [Burkholderiaceae bacterium]|nr:HIT family protein [Burkholderiaceae bacterium]